MGRGSKRHAVLARVGMVRVIVGRERKEVDLAMACPCLVPSREVVDVLLRRTLKVVA